jgi:tetratricopeptide (TPR) repeat protein
MRKTTTILAILCILIAAMFLVRKGYRSWAEQRAMTEAREKIQQEDYTQAALSLRRALQFNGNNVEAVRLMGNFAEVVHSPAVVFWRSRLVDLEPANTNRFALARMAIVHKQFDDAQRALDAVDEAGKKLPEYHKIMGEFATSTGKLLEAENHFQKAIQLQPDHPVLLRNLAMIRVQRKDEQLAAEARQQLEMLATNPVVRTDALRHLTLDALRQTNYTRALSMADQLVAESNSVFNDQLLRLEVMRAQDNTKFQEDLARLQKTVSTNAPRVFVLSRWMFQATSPKQTLMWLQAVDEKIRTELPVTLVVADTFAGTANWTGLQQWVEKQDWGEMEPVRLAMKARALREQGQEDAAQSEWAKAMAATEGYMDRLVALQRLAASWKWTAELEKVLDQIGQGAPGE